MIFKKEKKEFSCIRINNFRIAVYVFLQTQKNLKACIVCKKVSRKSSVTKGNML